MRLLNIFTIIILTSFFAIGQTTVGDCSTGGAAVSGGYSDANDANTNWNAGLESFSMPYPNNETVTTHHMVNSGATGAIGFAISTGSGNSLNQACIDDATRSAVLYAVNDCGGTAIVASTDSPGSNFSNYEFTGLTPNTNYILVVTIDAVNDCDVQDLAVTYYGITVNAAACDCVTPNCAAALTADAGAPTFTSCETWGGDETNSTIISYHTITSSADGTLGVLQQLQPTSCALTDADMQSALTNRSATLYAVGDCDGTPIAISTANAGNSGTLNPEWQGLTPNTQYIVKLEVSLLSCDIDGTCLDYYYPPASSCTADAGTISVDVNGSNVAGTTVDIPWGESANFSSAGYSLPNDGPSGSAGMALVAFSCPPTTGIASPYDLQSDPCYLGVLYGDNVTTTNDGSGTSALGQIFVVYMTFDHANGSGGPDTDADDCVDYSQVYEVNYLPPSTPDCGSCPTPDCPIQDVVAFGNRNYAVCENPVASGTYTQFHTVVADVNGTVGLVQGITVSGGDPVTDVTRTVYLLPLGDCGGTQINPNATNVAGFGSGFNPEWYNLTPGASYVLVIEFNIAAGVTLDEACADYYGVPNPPVYNCGTVGFDISAPGPFSCSDPVVDLTAHDPPDIFTADEWVYPGFIVTVTPNLGMWDGTNVIDIFINGVLVGQVDPAALGLGPFDTFILPITYAQPEDFTFGVSGNNGDTFDFTIVQASDGNTVDSGTWTIGGTDQSNAGVPVATALFTGAGVSDDPDNGGKGFFDPASAGTGTHTITYTYDNGAGCSGTATVDVVVTGPDASINGAGPFCDTEPSFALSTLVTGDAGGTWTIDGVAATDFDAASLGAGSFVVEYTVSSGGCSDVQNETIVVNASDDATFSYANAAYCNTDANPIASGIITAGGTFTSGDVSLVITDANTGEIDIAGSAIGGPYTITYTTTGACPSSSTFDVSINDCSVCDAGWSATTLCESDVPVALNTLLTTGNPGGTWTGAGVVNNGGTMEFDPSGLSGTVSVTYDLGACSETNDFTVTVTNAFFDYPSVTFCNTEANPLATNVAQPGGTFTSGDPNLIIADANTGEIDLVGSTLGGPYTITYSIGGACPGSATFNVTIADCTPCDPSWAGTTVCESQAAFDLTTLLTGTTGGTFSGTGVTGDFFDPAGLSGAISVTYDLGGGCTEVHDMTVILLDAGWTPLTAQCIGAGMTDLNASVTGSIGGTWSGTGLSGSNFDPSAYAASGLVPITYTVSSGACSIDSIANIEVILTPDPTFTVSDACLGSVVTLTHTGTVNPTTVFTWNWGGLSGFGSGSGDYDLGTPSQGNYTVSLTVQDGACASAPFALSFDVFPAATMNVAAADETCNGACDGIVVLQEQTGTYVLNPATFTWSDGGSGVSRTDMCAGDYSATITDDNGCTNTYDFTVGSPDPIMADTITNPASCNGFSDGSASIAIIGGTSPYTVEWSNLDQGVTATGLSAGNHTFTVTDANSCTTSGSVDVSEPGPVVNGEAIIVQGDNFFTNNPITFGVSGIVGFDTYDWTIDNNFEANGSSFTHQFEIAKNYVVSVEVSRDGCIDDISTIINIDEIFNIYVPTVFSPNGDGINDTFVPQFSIYSPSNYELYIYNRCGQLIFESNDPNKVWDGLDRDGNAVQEDVYVYKLIVEGEEPSDIYNKLGQVTLVK